MVAARLLVMLLTDDVVSLSPPRAEDAHEVAEAVQSSLDTLAVWMPWATPDYSVDSARQWMNEAGAAGRHSFLIRDPEGTVVGTCGLPRADVPNRCIELGYWVGKNHTGRGHATRAARLVIGHALDDLEFHRVEIIVSVQNRPSQRVAERLGARLEATLTERLDVRGSWHDAFLYAVVA